MLKLLQAMNFSLAISFLIKGKQSIALNVYQVGGEKKCKITLYFLRKIITKNCSVMHMLAS